MTSLESFAAIHILQLFGRGADSGDREAGIPSIYEDNTLP